MSEKRNFWDFLKILTRWRKILIINIIIVGLISLVISLFLPKWYKTSAIVTPIQEQKSIGGVASSLINNLPLSSFGLGGIGGGDEMTYMAILKSKSLAIDVINEFDLKDFYEKETMDETLRSFYADYDAQFTEENMIEITYEYTDSVRVAEIVNYIVKILKDRASQFISDQARSAFQLVERRYNKNLADLDSLANKMENFQSKYGIIEFTEQTKALIEASAQIEAEIINKQVELFALGNTIGTDHPYYLNLESQVNDLQNRLNELKFVQKDSLTSPFSTLFLPYNKFPELTKSYTKLYAEFLLQSKLQEFLLPQLEQARLQLSKSASVIRIIDPALKPDYKSKPKRSIIILSSVAVAIILTIIYILIAEKIIYIRKTDAEKFTELQEMRKLWLNPFRKGKKFRG